MTEQIIRTDSRGRISLSKFIKANQDYRVTVHRGGKVELLPVTSYTQEELLAELQAMQGAARHA